MEYSTKFKNGTEITRYLACAYAERFCEGENADFDDIVRAWSYLIGTGTVWKLQGFYGRTASSLIENNKIDKNGKILIDI